MMHALVLLLVVSLSGFGGLFELGEASDSRECCSDCPDENQGRECPPGCPSCHCAHGCLALPKVADERVVIRRDDRRAAMRRPDEAGAPRAPIVRGVYRPPRACAFQV